jgi:hypothetical protein
VADIDEVAAGLRAWAKGNLLAEAATELLIWHETWIESPTFQKTAMESGEGMWRINWDKARKLASTPNPRTQRQRSVLSLAIALATDQYDLSTMGQQHRRAILRSIAHAMHADELVNP